MANVRKNFRVAAEAMATLPQEVLKGVLAQLPKNIFQAINIKDVQKLIGHSSTPAYTEIAKHVRNAKAATQTIQPIEEREPSARKTPGKS